MPRAAAIRLALCLIANAFSAHKQREVRIDTKAPPKKESSLQLGDLWYWTEPKCGFRGKPISIPG